MNPHPDPPADADPMDGADPVGPHGSRRLEVDPFTALAFEFAARSFEEEYGIRPPEDRGSDD